MAETLRETLESLPHVNRVVGEIPGETLLYDAGVLIRKRIEAAGFRHIYGWEKPEDTLREAEEFFAAREVSS